MRSLRLSLLLTLFVTSACFPPDDGIDPPLDRIYFPVGMALSSGGDTLYVANSDFDLQFNAGSVQAFNAAQIRRLLPKTCAQDSDCGGQSECQHGVCYFDGNPCAEGTEMQSAAESAIAPGFCKLDDIRGVRRESARISPFVADLVYTTFETSSGARKARLLMPVRGDATVHWADAVHDQAGSGPFLECGQDNALKECDADHRRGDDSDEQTAEGESLEKEPFAIAVSTDGSVIAVGHQTRGAISLLENKDRGPVLRSVLKGLPVNPMAIAAVPPPQLAESGLVDYRPGFLVAFRHTGASRPSIELLRYFDDDASGHTPFLQRAGSVPITVSSGFDSRGIAVDDSERLACEQTCVPELVDGDAGAGGETPLDCLTRCAATPLDVFVANRSPSALLIGKTRPGHTDIGNDELPNLSDMVSLRGGPSKVWTGCLDVSDVEQACTETRVFAIAFDSRLFYIYNPATRRIETRLLTGRGPQAFAFDPANRVGYLAHFTDSYIGVIDLDPTHATYGQFLLTVGNPTPPRASQ